MSLTIARPAIGLRTKSCRLSAAISRGRAQEEGIATGLSEKNTGQSLQSIKTPKARAFLACGLDADISMESKAQRTRPPVSTVIG
jgi:hypothetical protein